MTRARVSRRRVMQFAAALPLIGRGGAAMAQGGPQTVVYVSNAGSKDIYCLSMNRDTGELTMIEKTPVPGSEKTTPTSLPMTTSRDRKFLYAQLRSEPYPLSTFAIDRASGKLSNVATTPLVDQMAYINTDRSGKYLLAASYVGAKLCIYPIDPKTGIVGSKATQLLDTKPKAHCVYVGAANHIYVPVLGGDEVLELNLAADGTVTPNGPGAVHTKQGAGPRHFTIHPNGRWAYLITETTATIGQYDVDPATGQLTEVGFVDTGDYKEQPAASDIHVTPNGRFLYGAERKTSMLHGFKIDEKNGKLTKIGSFPTEKTPRGFNIDPRGKFLLSVGMDSASMTVYEIAADGRLGPLKQYPMGTNPNWVEIVDLA
ncbi:MAG TPA: beta-propeller fold lactonase family protein [Stellaceae bacterium]|nr:beta-propeller fold lactonase family protein [Stellaceae bacterium]